MKTLIKRKEYLRDKININGVNLDFSDGPISVEDEIADFCVKNFPERYEVKGEVVLNESQKNFIDLLEISELNKDSELEEVKKFVSENEIIDNLKGSGNVKTTENFIQFVLKKLEEIKS